MKFSEKLKEAMQQLNLKQSQIVGMTGCSKGAVSQYLSGKTIPPPDKQREIAVSLGLSEDYFQQNNGRPARPSRETILSGEFIRLNPVEVGRVMHASHTTIENGLRNGKFDWGYAIPPEEGSTHWTYIINGVKFAEIERLIIHEETGGKENEAV